MGALTLSMRPEGLYVTWGEGVARISILSSIVAVSTSIPTNSVGGFPLFNFYDRYKLYHTNHSPSHRTLLVLMYVYPSHLVLVAV